MLVSVVQKKINVINVYFDGRPILAAQGDTIALALLRNGVVGFRSSVLLGEQRAPYCMMGVCFECLVKVNGGAAERACQRCVAPEMRIERCESVAEMYP